MQKLNTLEDFGRKAHSYVDCYISTDALDMEDILMDMGFQEIPFAERDKNTLLDLYEENRDWLISGLYGSVVKDYKTGLKIDYVDTPLEEALEISNDIGFMPMSKFRVYTNGSPNVAKILLPLVKNPNRSKLRGIQLQRNKDFLLLKMGRSKLWGIRPIFFE